MCQFWHTCCRASWAVAGHDTSPALVSKAGPDELEASLVLAPTNPRVAEACLLRAIEFIEVPRRARDGICWVERRNLLLSHGIIAHTLASMGAHSRDVRVARRGCCILGQCVREALFGDSAERVLAAVALQALPALVESIKSHGDLRVLLLATQALGKIAWSSAESSADSTSPASFESVLSHDWLHKLLASGTAEALVKAATIGLHRPAGEDGQTPLPVLNTSNAPAIDARNVILAHAMLGVCAICSIGPVCCGAKAALSAGAASVVLRVLAAPSDVAASQAASLGGEALHCLWLRLREHACRCVEAMAVADSYRHKEGHSMFNTAEVGLLCIQRQPLM